MDWRDTLTALLRTAVIGIPLAALSFFLLLTVSGPVMANAAPSWIAESLFGAIAATIWMAVGLHAGVRTVPSAVLLFGIGAVASWMLTLKIVHSVSVYYGMPPFVLACVAGIVTGTVLLGGASRRSRLGWLGAALAIMGIGIARHLWSDPPGDARSLRDAAGAFHRAGVFGAPGGPHYAWIPDGAVIAGGEGTTRAAAIELDPGSGHNDVLLTRVTDEAALAEARRHAAAGERHRIAGDVERGDLPAGLRGAPFPVWMDRGTVWVMTRAPIAR